jgi:hypothetical protein
MGILRKKVNFGVFNEYIQHQMMTFSEGELSRRAKNGRSRREKPEGKLGGYLAVPSFSVSRSLLDAVALARSMSYKA